MQTTDTVAIKMINEEIGAMLKAEFQIKIDPNGYPVTTFLISSPKFTAFVPAYQVMVFMGDKNMANRVTVRIIELK